MSASRPRIGPKGPIGPRGPTGFSPTDASGNLDMSCNNILDVSNIYFCNSAALLGPIKDVSAVDYPGLITTDTSLVVITCSGELDMSCNSIIDISSQFFCDDIILTSSNSAFPNISIGNTAKDYSTLGSIEIGTHAGTDSSFNHFSVAIGTNAGNASQSSYSVAIGQSAAFSDQGIASIAIGKLAGGTSQDASAVAIGPSAGNTRQAYNSVAIGENAGKTDQSFNCIAIGTDAGLTDQGFDALGDAIAIGNRAGKERQNRAIAIGPRAGEIDQSSNSISIGTLAGQNNQGTGSIAIGVEAGKGSSSFNQKSNAIAIGNNAASSVLSDQGESAIAIGHNAGKTDAHANSIIINAQGSTELNSDGTSRFYVKPIRADVSDNVLYYDNSSGEITYGIGANISGTLNEMTYISPNTTSVRSTSDAIVDTGNNQILLNAANTPALPVLSFQGDPNTGIYRQGADIMSISSGGTQKVTIASSSSVLPFIDGLNVGNASSIAGIRRVSATLTNAWEDGHLGNSDGIFFTPHDFNSNTLGREYAVISSDISRCITRNHPFVGITASYTQVNACKLIPKGFIINEECTITIYTADADGTGGSPPRRLTNIPDTALYLYTQGLIFGPPHEYDGEGLVSSIAYTTNSALTITSSMSSILADGYTYVCIAWDPINPLSNTQAAPGLYGAYITMKRV
jgi:hypothetical protein